MQDTQCFKHMAKIHSRHIAPEDMDRIIGMAWEDRTPFEAIEYQFGLSEAQVIQLMRRELTPGSWRRWRTRVQGRNTKHLKLRSLQIGRFRSKAQRLISMNKRSKRR